MKIIRHKVIYFFISIAMIFIGCYKPLPLPPSNEFVTFQITGVNIGINTGKVFGDSINMFEFSIGKSVSNPFEPDTFILSEGVVYNNNKLILSTSNGINKYFTYKIDKNLRGINADTLNVNDNIIDIYTFDLYDFYESRFFIKEGQYSYDIYRSARHLSPSFGEDGHHKKLLLRTNTSNDISLTYNLGINSIYDTEVDLSLDDYVYRPYGRGKSRLINYNAEWANISNYWPHQYTDDMINIVFMAESFTETNVRMRFESDVGNLRREVDNSVLPEYREKINYIRLNTVSLDEANSIIGIRYRHEFGEITRIKDIINTSFIGSPIRMNTTTGETNIDLIVIVNNPGPIESYTTNETTVFLKNGSKDVHVIVMPYERYWLPSEYSLTSQLKILMPELFPEDNL